MMPHPNISRYLPIAGALTVLGALCVVLVIYLLVSLYKDDIVMAKQCTDTDTAASMERLEEGGVIKDDFSQTPVTEEMCGEINDRALLVGTNPVARAIEVARVVQEFRIIQDSMRAADENQLASRLTDSSPSYEGMVAGSQSGRPETIKMSPLSFSMAGAPCGMKPDPAPSDTTPSDDATPSDDSSGPSGSDTKSPSDDSASSGSSTKSSDGDSSDPATSEVPTSSDTTPSDTTPSDTTPSKKHATSPSEKHATSDPATSDPAPPPSPAPSPAPAPAPAPA